MPALADTCRYGMVWGALIQDLQKHHPDADLSVLNLIVVSRRASLDVRRRRAHFALAGLAKLWLECGSVRYGPIRRALVRPHPPHSSRADLTSSPAAASRCASSLCHLSSYIHSRSAPQRMIAIGSTLSVILLVCSAVAVDSLPALFVLQGILLGIAHGISLPLFMTIPSQWFSRRRGFATGITVSGTGWGGGIASLIMRAMLPSLGYRNTLLVYAGISAVVYAFAWSLLKVRKPPARATPARWETKTGLPPGIFRDPAFYSLVASVTVGVWGASQDPLDFEEGNEARSGNR